MNNLPPLTERIDKGAPGGHEFERLLNQLLIAFANAKRFEYEPAGGAGGDDGIDGLARNGGVPGLDGPVAFQCKWLWGNIHKSPKAGQITDSLQRAADAFPDLRHYVLITPHDLTPAEKKWLLALKPRCDLIVHHWGQARVEGLLREHAPKLFARYYPHEAATALGGATGNAFDPQVLAPYFDYVAKAIADIRLAGIDPKAGDPNTCQRLQLPNLYDVLDTEQHLKPTHDELAKLRTHRAGTELAEMERAEQISVPALEAAAAQSRLVLTGRPGSGKTTFVRYLCLCFARHGLKSGDGWLAKLKPYGWPEELLVPITVELRYFARSLPAKLPETPSERENSPQPRDLWDFFVRTTLQPNKLEVLEPMLAQTVADGRALVIFEGLDEVPSGPQRIHVHQAILRFAAAAQFQASRVLVTCRSRAYEQKSLELSGFTEAPLADFNEPKIRQFTEAWYTELARLDEKPPGEYAPRGVRLYQAIRVPSLWPHAGRPMLLTVMANVHAKNDRLPKDRAQVYAEMVEILVESWDNVRLEDLAPLRRLLEAARKDKKDLIRFLGELAFEAHLRDQGKGKGRDALADIPKLGTDGLLEKLKGFCGSYDNADSLIDAIDQRAGLLVSPDVGSGIYQFPHRSFQEYLAGMHLANEPDFVQRAVDLVDA